MAGEKVDEYIQGAYRRLDLRKLDRKKPDMKRKASTTKAEVEWGPTNAQLKRIMEGLVKGLSGSDSEEDKSCKNLIKIFWSNGVDLVEVAAATFWGIRKESQIRTQATKLHTLKAAEHKSRQRAKVTGQQSEQFLSPRDLKRFLAGFSRRQDIAYGEEQLTQLSTSHPNFPTSKRKPTTGRRQDLPVKIMHLELERFFARNHSNVPAIQRRVWIRRIVNASQPVQYSRKTFQKRTARLRHQIPSFAAH